MSNDNKYKNLEIWKEAKKLVSLIDTITIKFLEDKKVGLTSLIKRAVIFIPPNIVEGIGRIYNKETRQFFYKAKSLLYEVETPIYLALDLGVIEKIKNNNSLIKLFSLAN